MACGLPQMYGRFYVSPWSPRVTAAAFHAASGSCMPYQNTELWTSCQPLTVLSTRLVRLMSYRRSGDTCGWYAPRSNASRIVSSVSTKHVAVCHRIHSPEVTFLGWLRSFGTQRVVQKRRHQMRILHPVQTPYRHHVEGTRPPPIPHSLTATGTIKRLLNCNSAAAKEAASRINWEAYVSHKKGVRWHPQGAWRVQFTRKNHERNFFVRCECYFKVGDYGFETAKELAIRYRERLEREWQELQQQWNRLDIREARARIRSRTGVEIETQHPLSPHGTTEGETPDTNTSKYWSTERKSRGDK